MTGTPEEAGPAALDDPVVEVRLPAGDPGGYRVHVAPGLLDELGRMCDEAAPAHRYAVVADETVAGRYGERALAALEAVAAADLHTFPPGEGHKDRDQWRRLTDALLAAGHGRDSAVVALGGGVTGDLAGFVASTFLRGVPVVQVPTSLLAMVDAAVGGKTGTNTAAGKNLVGTFHHPRLVVADTTTLATLPEEHLAAGLAEAVRSAAVADPALFEWMEARAGSGLATDAEELARLVRACVAVKAAVVSEDPTERGRREVLNFGHTVGHALERLSGWDLLHGHAVAAGMRVEARLGEELGVTAAGTARRLTELLDRCGHVGRPERGRDPREVLEAAGSDKKSREGSLRWVLLERIGRVSRDAGGAWARALPEGRERPLLELALRASVSGTGSRSEVS